MSINDYLGNFAEEGVNYQIVSKRKEKKVNDFNNSMAFLFPGALK